MKLSIQLLGLAMLSLFTMSCNKDNNEPIQTNPISGLTLVQTLKNNDHQIELYSTKAQWEQGYNEIYFRIKTAAGTYLDNTNPSWQATMFMTSMSHGCPSIAPLPSTERKGLYQGALIFQMASNDSEYWELKIQYQFNGQTFTASDKINVKAATKRNVSVFKGSDNSKYVLALVSPQKPKVGVNNLQAVLFKMVDMNTFSVVNNYHIKVDPRMPAMGNHGSPNNVDLSQISNTPFYQGKLNLSMTGYWKINLQLLDASNQVLKGEPIAESVESSSIFWEVEF